VKDPQEALEAARAAAGAVAARGGGVREPLDLAPVTRVADWQRLSEWAIIEPDAAKIYSTRRFGAPLTWLKRALLRFLRQYNDQILAQQSRFNAHVLAHVMNLDERVRELEKTAGERSRPADPAPTGTLDR
jgi:hypothetical protein